MRLRDDDGTWTAPYSIRPYDSMLSEFADPERVPQPGGTRTPVLGHDGADVAAALQTTRETGDAEPLDVSSQIITISHSRPLIDALLRAAGGHGAPVATIELTRDFGETVVAGQETFDQPAWYWPKR